MEHRNPLQWAILPLKKYAVFSGRAPRAEYWWFVLAASVVGVALGFVDAALTGPIYGAYGPFGLVFTLALAVPGLAVLVRRLHDTGKSGWWALVRAVSYVFLVGGASAAGLTTWIEQLPGAVLIALAVMFLGWGIAAFALFLFVITEGDGGPNRYGSDPYGGDELEEVFA